MRHGSRPPLPPNTRRGPTFPGVDRAGGGSGARNGPGTPEENEESR
ncbi:hypothetical protein SAMN04487905_109248 [Actinopolyspora xinjiangensis]|uniref:Uncharacterized protein n=1 Tax=Actinopolyspora xinjiangensis TaxID=405564 RepID=A0A1H0VU46_9ACTN|nr:hypothetical protein SAMN04487905_109248 [Actinopolyspora xinjiangensis]